MFVEKLEENDFKRQSPSKRQQSVSSPAPQCGASDPNYLVMQQSSGFFSASFDLRDFRTGQGETDHPAEDARDRSGPSSPTSDAPATTMSRQNSGLNFARGSRPRTSPERRVGEVLTSPSSPSPKHGCLAGSATSPNSAGGRSPLRLLTAPIGSKKALSSGAISGSSKAVSPPTTSPSASGRPAFGDVASDDTTPTLSRATSPTTTSEDERQPEGRAKNTLFRDHSEYESSRRYRVGRVKRAVTSQSGASFSYASSKGEHAPSSCRSRTEEEAVGIRILVGWPRRLAPLVLGVVLLLSVLVVAHFLTNSMFKEFTEVFSNAAPPAGDVLSKSLSVDSVAEVDARLVHPFLAALHAAAGALQANASALDAAALLSGRRLVAAMHTTGMTTSMWLLLEEQMNGEACVELRLAPTAAALLQSSREPCDACTSTVLTTSLQASSSAMPSVRMSLCLAESIALFPSSPVLAALDGVHSLPILSRCAALSVVYTLGTTTPLILLAHSQPASSGITRVAVRSDTQASSLCVHVTATNFSSGNVSLCRGSLVSMLALGERTRTSILPLTATMSAVVLPSQSLLRAGEVGVVTSGAVAELRHVSIFLAPTSVLPLVQAECMDAQRLMSLRGALQGGFWGAVWVVIVVGGGLAWWAAARHTRRHAAGFKSWMAHVALLCHALQESQRHSLKSTTQQLLEEDAEALRYIEGVSPEASWYATCFVPRVCERFEYYRSFLPKTNTSTFRLPPLTLPMPMSNGPLFDCGPQGLPRLESGPFAHSSGYEGPSLIVHPASPETGGHLPPLDESMSGRFSPFGLSKKISNRSLRDRAALILDNSGELLAGSTSAAPATPGELPPLPPHPAKVHDPNFIPEEKLPSPTHNRTTMLGLHHTNMTVFTPRAPGAAPSGAASPYAGASPRPPTSVASYSPVTHGLPGAPLMSGDTSIVIHRSPQQNLSLAQSHALSIAVTATGFIDAVARPRATPRYSTAENSLRVGGLLERSKSQHFHSPHTPRPSIAQHEAFVSKRATVLTCSATFAPQGIFPSATGSPVFGRSSDSASPDAAGDVSPRLNYRAFSSDSQKFLKAAIDTVEQCDGSVIEMTAHSLTVAWNAVSPYPFHELRAVQCAMHMATHLDECLPEASVHIAIVTGGVLVGHVGSTRTMKRCVLGMAVYFSQLLVQLGRLIHCSILVTESTYFMARTRITCVPVEVAMYDGQVWLLYEALGAKEEHFSAKDLDLANRGFAALCNGKFADSLVFYEHIIQQRQANEEPTDLQVLRLATAARSLRAKQELQANGESNNGPSSVSYMRQGPSWLVHEVAADDVRLPDDVLAALGDAAADAGGATDGDDTTTPSRPISPCSTLMPHAPSHSGSRRTSVNPIFELRAELERQLLEKTVRASAQSMNRSPSGTYLPDDFPNLDTEDRLGSAHGIARQQSAASLDKSADMTEIVDRKGQCWRRSNKRLGRGTFGEVYVGLQSDGSLCAIKMVTLPNEIAVVDPWQAGTSGAAQFAAFQGYSAFAQRSPSCSFVDSSQEVADNAVATSQHLHSAFGEAVGPAPPPTTPMSHSLGTPRLPPTSVLSKEVDQLLQEVATLSSVKSDYVVRYYGSAVFDGAICIVMEYIGGGSLTNLVRLFGALSVNTVRRYTMDVLRGLKALHALKIVHRDVSPNNVLVTIDGMCKLSDFGCSQSLHRINRSNVAGTPQYMAPEACRGEATTASDIWSVGILTHVLLTGALPFAPEDLNLPSDTFVRRLGATRNSSGAYGSRSVSLSTTPLESVSTTSTSLEGVKEPLTLTLRENGLPADALEFLQACLLRDPALRPTAEQLLRHPFVLK